MTARRKRKTSENGEPDPRQVDQVVLLLVAGFTGSKLRTACTKQGLSGKEVEAAIPEARRRITVAAETDHDEEVGKAVLRLNDLYARCVNTKAHKTALDAQRELNRLLGLYEVTVGEGEDGDLHDQAGRAMAYLMPLKLSRKKAPTIVELCRLAAAKIISYEDRK